MELALPENFVDGEGLDFKEFGMDKGVAMLVLRQKIYSDSRKAVVQEYSSNSRDANREAGRGDIPIKIYGPTQECPEFIFQDNGLGITPDRMDNVFVHYGRSTKRTSNNQTGGWGLGCKAAFAIADTFRVETVWDSGGGKLREAVYLMAISKEQTNVYTCLSNEEAAEGAETGTRICIPVDDDDRDYLTKCVRDIVKFWGHPYVKDSAYPIVVLNGEQCPTPHFEIDEHEADLPKCMTAPGRNGGTLILDGIQYSLRNALGRHGFSKSEEKILEKLWLFFDTGELMVTATREDIDYSSDATLSALRDRVAQIVTTYRTRLTGSIEGKDYWETSRIVEEQVGQFGELFATVFENFDWEDPETKERKPMFRFSTGMFHNDTGISGVQCHSVTASTDTNSGYSTSVTSRPGTRLDFYRGHCAIVWADSTKLAGRLRAALKHYQNDVEVQRVILVIPPQLQRRGGYGSGYKRYEDVTTMHFLKWVAQYPWCKHLVLSTLNPIPPPPRVIINKSGEAEPAKRVTKDRLYARTMNNHSSGSWELTERSLLTQKGGVFVFLNKTKGMFHNPELTETVNDLSDYFMITPTSRTDRSIYSGIPIYGIDPSMVKHLAERPGWISLKQYVAIRDARVANRYGSVLGVEAMPLNIGANAVCRPSMMLPAGSAFRIMVRHAEQQLLLAKHSRHKMSTKWFWGTTGERHGTDDYFNYYGRLVQHAHSRHRDSQLNLEFLETLRYPLATVRELLFVKALTEQGYRRNFPKTAEVRSSLSDAFTEAFPLFKHISEYGTYDAVQLKECALYCAAKINS